MILLGTALFLGVMVVVMIIAAQKIDFPNIKIGHHPRPIATALPHSTAASTVHS